MTKRCQPPLQSGYWSDDCAAALVNRSADTSATAAIAVALRSAMIPSAVCMTSRSRAPRQPRGSRQAMSASSARATSHMIAQPLAPASAAMHVTTGPPVLPTRPCHLLDGDAFSWPDGPLRHAAQLDLLDINRTAAAGCVPGILARQTCLTRA